MRRRLILMGCGAALVVMGACERQPYQRSANQQPRTQQSTPPRARQQPRTLTEDVTLTVVATVQPDKRVLVTGDTNLPSGTHFFVGVVDPLGASGGDTECKVGPDGRYSVELFGPASGVKDGVYVVEVVMPMPSVQSSAVRRVIGEDGEHLRGPLVDRYNLLATVRATASVAVGSNVETYAHYARQIENLRLYQQFLEETEALAERLEAARPLRADPDNLTNLSNWGWFARQFVWDAQALRQRADQLQDVRARMAVGVPVGELLNVFHDVAIQNDDYERDMKLYGESLAALRSFIAEQRAILDGP